MKMEHGTWTMCKKSSGMDDKIINGIFLASIMCCT